MATKNTSNTRPSNYVIFTLRAHRKDGDDGGVQVSPNTGQPFAKSRASLSMGKNPDGSYKPSMWFELMGYTPEKEGDIPNEVTEAVGALQKGDYVTVKGRLSYEEWTGQDGAVRTTNTIWVQSIEPFVFENGNGGAPAPTQDAGEDYEDTDEDFVE